MSWWENAAFSTALTPKKYDSGIDYRSKCSGYLIKYIKSSQNSEQAYISVDKFSIKEWSLMPRLDKLELFPVRDYGAAADGRADDTEAILKAVKACYESGGGTVVFTPGRYLTGPFEIMSNILLCLEPGSVILGSTDIDRYFITHTSMESPRIGLIYARNASNVGIVGKGTIDCRGTAFMDMGRPKEGYDFERRYTRQGERYMRFENGVEDGPVEPLDRPGNSIQFIGCENVVLRDITVLNSPNWTIHFDDSKDIIVSGISIKNNLLIPNSDGIHFTTCKNVRVSDCNIESGDDSLAFTGYGFPGHKTENVVVTNCTLVSRSSGIRIGYGDNDVENLLFNNLIIRSNRGLGVFQRNKGNIGNIIFSNIIINTRLHTGHWWGHGEPIHVSTVFNEGTAQPGTIGNVKFSNITARSETGILVYGCQDSIIRDVSFDNIHLTIVPSRLSESYGGNMDLRPTDNRSASIFRHDEFGLYARYADSLDIHKFKLDWEGKPAEYFKDAVRCEHCHNLNIDGFTGRQPHEVGEGAAVAVSRSRGVSIRNCRAQEGTTTFLLHEDVEDAVLITGNDLSRDKTAIKPAELQFMQYGNRA